MAQYFQDPRVSTYFYWRLYLYTLCTRHFEIHTSKNGSIDCRVCLTWLSARSINSSSIAAYAGSNARFSCSYGSSKRTIINTFLLLLIWRFFSDLFSKDIIYLCEYEKNVTFYDTIQFIGPWRSCGPINHAAAITYCDVPGSPCQMYGSFPFKFFVYEASK